MNLLDVDATPPLRALEAVRGEAEREGVEVDGSEIVGLLPARALPADPDRALALRTPAAGRVLEERIRETLGGG
jgi:glutamate formiminotransferase